MKLRILSDLHLEFNPLTLKNEGEDVLILAGDVGTGLQYHQQMALKLITDYLDSEYKGDNKSKHRIIMVAGNHEYYNSDVETVIEFWKKIKIDRFYFLDGDDVVLDNNIRFWGATLFTDFHNKNADCIISCQNNLNDFHHINKMNAQKWLNYHDLHKQKLEQLLDEIEPDKQKLVIVTHYLPSYDSINEFYRKPEYEKMHAGFACKDMDEIMKNKKISLWCHGHTHKSCDYTTIDGLRVICNPRGYNKLENPPYDEGLMVDI